MKRHLRRMFSTALTVGIAVLLTACKSEDKSQSMEGMPVQAQQILVQMNALGAVEQEGNTYKYRLRAACQLEVTEFLERSGAERVLLGLADARYEQFEYAISLGYALRVATDPATPAIFRAAGSGEVEKMHGLIKDLASSCPPPS